MRQLAISCATVVFIAASVYVSAALGLTYFAAWRGTLHGAGAAQWQYQFLLAPLPASLGLAALATAWFVAKPLKAPLMILAAVAAATPIVLYALVQLQIY